MKVSCDVSVVASEHLQASSCVYSTSWVTYYYNIHLYGVFNTKGSQNALLLIHGTIL